MLQGEEVPSIITTNEGEGWDEVDSESIDEVIEEKDTNKKSFSVGSIAVSHINFNERVSVWLMSYYLL